MRKLWSKIIIKSLVQELLKQNQYRYEMGKWKGTKMENNAQRENRENKIEQKKLLDIRHERGK